jgi:hypothetical protein
MVSWEAKEKMMKSFEKLGLIKIGAWDMASFISSKYLMALSSHLKVTSF